MCGKSTNSVYVGETSILKWGKGKHGIGKYTNVDKGNKWYTLEYNPWTMKILLIRSVYPTCFSSKFTQSAHSYHFSLCKKNE